MSKTALILGCAGQDGSYLADLLLEKGYNVHGLYRHGSHPNALWRIEHCKNRLVLHRGDVLDQLSIDRAVSETTPDEIYNMADQDSVAWSFEAPVQQLDITAGTVIRLLESVRRFAPCARVFQPCSATMYGELKPPQNEAGLMVCAPASPYACAKEVAWRTCCMYAHLYNLYVSCGVMFNHDSPRRSEDYLLSRIARQAVRVSRGELDKVRIGCPHRRVDIGYAPEYMDAAWRMLQQDEPGDYVVATGRAYPIMILVSEALIAAGCNPDCWEIDHTYTPSPGPECTWIGDATKAREALGWEPKHDAHSLVRLLSQSCCGVDGDTRASPGFPDQAPERPRLTGDSRFDSGQQPPGLFF